MCSHHSLDCFALSSSLVYFSDFFRDRKPKAEPPTFLKKIGDCEVFKGMTAKFTACAAGYPEPEVEWYRGNIKLFPSERIRMERESTGLLRLTIIGVDPTLDVGLYRCRIYNDHGEEFCEGHMVYDSKFSGMVLHHL